MIGIKLGLTYGGAPTMLQQALSAIRRNGGTLLLPGLPRNWLDSAGTIAATVDNPVGLVQDSVGSNHASQPTTASKPLLRRTSGRYSWEFDGSNDFLQTGITTGNEGWICAGVSIAPGATTQTIASSGAGDTTQKGVFFVAVAGATISAYVGNGASRMLAQAPITAGVPQVLSMGWSAAGVVAGGGNTESAPTAFTGDVTGPVSLRIGQYIGGTLPLNCPMHAIAYTPVLPSAADRALIRRFVGSLQGQTL